jgi:hypothetical protein
VVRRSARMRFRWYDGWRGCVSGGTTGVEDAFSGGTTEGEDALSGGTTEGEDAFPVVRRKARMRFRRYDGRRGCVSGGTTGRSPSLHRGGVCTIGRARVFLTCCIQRYQTSHLCVSDAPPSIPTFHPWQSCHVASITIHRRLIPHEQYWRLCRETEDLHLAAV